MPTRYRGTEEEVRALNAFINLMRAAESLKARLHGPLDDAGLTLGQFAALEALLHLGPLRQHELAGKLLVSPGNLTIVLNNLQRRRLVRRRRDSADRRCTRVSITEKGRGLLEAVLPAHVQRVVDAFGVLNPSEQKDLRGLCRRIGRGE